MACSDGRCYIAIEVRAPAGLIALDSDLTRRKQKL